MFTVSLQTSLLRRGTLARGEEILLDVVTGAVRSATARMKTGGRRQIERAGLGRRLPKALRSKVIGDGGADITFKGRSATPVGYVWSKALVKRGGPPIDLLEVFETGVVVSAKGGPYLAVPARTHPAGRKAKPLESLNYAQFRVVPVGGMKRGRPAANRVAFLVIHRSDNVVWYLLIKTARVKKRLRLLPLAARLQAQLPADLQRRAIRATDRLEALL